LGYRFFIFISYLVHKKKKKKKKKKATSANYTDRGSSRIKKTTPQVSMKKIRAVGPLLTDSPGGTIHPGKGDGVDLIVLSGTG
jgi:hypothetical protein